MRHAILVVITMGEEGDKNVVTHLHLDLNRVEQEDIISYILLITLQQNTQHKDMGIILYLIGVQNPLTRFNQP